MKTIGNTLHMDILFLNVTYCSLCINLYYVQLTVVN